MSKIPLHIKILIGMAFGLVWGLLSIYFNLDPSITAHWIQPLGTLFTSSLKMIAIPLIISSLIVGVGGLGDISTVSKFGKRTFILFISTTICAITIGVLLSNIIHPGKGLSVETKNKLLTTFSAKVEDNTKKLEASFGDGPLTPLVDVVPENIFNAFSNNGSMIQVVFFVLIFSIGLILIDKSKSRPVISFFDGVNEVILKLIDYIMLYSPIGVFGLVAGVVIQLPNFDILLALMKYAATVLIGCGLMLLVIYPALIYFITKSSLYSIYGHFRPVQLLAFSTSSSSATLPVTMEVSQEKLGIKPDVASFVLPMGSTVNMDGTSLYQAVATIFIAEVFDIHLDIWAQLSIIILALITSIGAAGVPGAGMILLAVILEANKIPVQGIALILAIDRVLDMCRTVVNVTGDMVVAYIVNDKTKEENYGKA